MLWRAKGSALGHRESSSIQRGLSITLLLGLGLLPLGISSLGVISSVKRNILACELRVNSMWLMEAARNVTAVRLEARLGPLRKERTS